MTFTPALDRLLASLRVSGLPWREIGNIIGCTGDQARYRFRAINRREPPPDTSKHKERKCLRCRAFFASTGPGNRICAPCTEVNAVICDLAPDTVSLDALDDDASSWDAWRC